MGVTFLKKGVDSVKAVEKADQEAELRKQQNNKTWRFLLSKGEEASVTFIDGNLTPDGVLDIVTFREHTLYMNGNWNNHFVCTSDVEPCPICEGKDQPALVGLLTVIDHRTTKSKDGTKTYSNQKRLFVAKKDTIKLLQNIAVKRGGLVGARFDISRIGEKSASVGTQFDFMEKTSLEELKAKYQHEEIQADGKTKKMVTTFVPVDYEKEIVYQDRHALKELGFGIAPIGGESAPTENSSMTHSMDYDNNL